MLRTVRSPFVPSALVLALAAAPGCIGERRPQPGQAQKAAVKAAQGPAPLVQPQDVDGKFDALVQGERVRVTYDERDPYTGAARPLVTIVEFSDFQCPFCSRLADSLHELSREYPDDVRLVFKQLPLPMHAQAEPAARAALAAHQQGKFWELHDLMFANQKALGDGQLRGYASSLGLDMERWGKDFASDELAKRVTQDKALAATLGVRSTPTFYVNGKLFKGAKPPEQIRSIIDQEILAARALLDAGASRNEIYARILHPAPPLEGGDAPTEAAPSPAPPPADAPAPAGDAPAPADGAPDPAKNYAVATGGRPSRGPDDALVTIVEYGAFDCKNCRAIQPALRQVLARHPEDVRLVFRNLAEGVEARRAAQIALAAGMQGKFWEAHDALMTLEGEFGIDAAKKLATDLGIDVEKFSTDLRDIGEGGPRQRIVDDIASLEPFRGGAEAPVLFVNGRYVTGNPSAAQLEALIVEEKAKAEAFRVGGKTVTGAARYDAMRKTWDGYSG